MFRPRFGAPRLAFNLGLRSTVNARRQIHSLPDLHHDFSEGIPKLMSPAGFNIAWTQYQSFVLEKLNALTVGTELGDKETKDIAIMTAREPSQAPIFNYASMAHNNHFYFEAISPNGTPMPEPLQRELEAAFSSIETLKREFVITASSMFGPGFLWLVKGGPGDYRILPTYLAGSPYPGAHWRAQSSDMNTLGKDGSAQGYLRNQLQGYRKREGGLPPGGIDVVPLLCLNTWEHAWLLDWGVGLGGKGGKTAFTESWFNLIDWEMVHRRSGDSTKGLYKTAME